MPKRLNTHVLCLIDEYGTAGSGAPHPGAVLVLARDAGRVDKTSIDLLEPDVNEVHTIRLRDSCLQGLLQRFWQAAPTGRVTLVDQKAGLETELPSTIYAQAVVRRNEAGLKRFKGEVLGRETIGNVELIKNRNDRSTGPAFDAELARAQARDGRFEGEAHVARIDSTASRLLQLADCGTYHRKWIANGEVNARGLRSSRREACSRNARGRSRAALRRGRGLQPEPYGPLDSQGAYRTRGTRQPVPALVRRPV